MGSGKDIIFSYAERSLRKKFSPSEGWEFERNLNGDNIGVDYVVSRKWQGAAQQVYAAVMMKPELLQSDVDSFIAAIPEGKNAKGKILVVPAGADCSLVPSDVEIVEMKGFSCEENKVVWSRRTLPLETDAE
jgi:hypothetical protein